jgi:hypothetical protein
VKEYNSRLVVTINGIEHHISHGTSDFYMVNNLKKFYHSFENGTVEPATGKHHTPFTSYPIGTDYFSPDGSMSIARYPAKQLEHLDNDERETMQMRILQDRPRDIFAKRQLNVSAA